MYMSLPGVGRQLAAKCARRVISLPRTTNDSRVIPQICRYSRKGTNRKGFNMHIEQPEALAPGWDARQSTPFATAFWSNVNSCQGDLVDALIRAGHIKSQRVQQAMCMVDRRFFINPEYATSMEAYEDRPLPIDHGQTISAPHMHAICLELLEGVLRPGTRVLDVGSGSGYMTAAMALMVGPQGWVIGVDKVVELVHASLTSIQKSNPELLLPEEEQPQHDGSAATAAAGTGAAAVASQPRIRIVHGNALSDVPECRGPFDAIHVGAASDELHPELLDRLKPGGRMVIPVGPRYSQQVLMVVDKEESGELVKQTLMEVGYVPLTRPSEAENGYSAGVD